MEPTDCFLGALFFYLYGMYVYRCLIRDLWLFNCCQREPFLFIPGFQKTTSEMSKDADTVRTIICMGADTYISRPSPYSDNVQC